MKIYKAFLYLSALLFVGVVSAQEVKCDESVAVFKKLYVTKKYDDAVAALPALQKSCAKYDEALYKYGGAIYEYQIETAKSDDLKKKALDKAVALYDAQMKNFPKGDGAVRKAMLMYNNKLGVENDWFALLDQAFEVNRAGFTSYRAFELYYNLIYAKYTAKEKGFDHAVFFKRYTDILGQISAAHQEVTEKRALYLERQKKSASTPEEDLYLEQTKHDEGALEAVADNIAKQNATRFDCVALEAAYQEGFEKNAQSVSWVKGMMVALKAAKCKKSDLYFKGAEIIYKAKPTYESAYELGQLYQKKNKLTEAADFFRVAANLQDDPVRKSEILLVLADFYRGTDKAKAKEYILKAAAANPKSGRPYLVLAEMYMSVQAGECGITEFERKALVWPALENLKKAEVAEPKLKATVAGMETAYLKQVPTKKEAKAAKKRKDDVITYGCWINESVTLPKLK